MKKNIILTGMPGSGKSTAGVLLAKTLCRPFLDTDLLIQEKEGRPLQSIIDSDGLEAFLNIEERCILTVNCENTVIATGGSAVLRENSMLHLKKNGHIIYLKLSPENLEKRINNIVSRGIAAKKGETIPDILSYRSPLYEKYCDFLFNCNGKDIEEVVDGIAKHLKNGQLFA